MKNSDKLAFPFEGGDNNGIEPAPGLTKREYFAGLALQGILSNQNYEAPRRKRLGGMAIDALSAADALLAELDKS